MFDAAGAAYAACKAALDVWEEAAAGVTCHTAPATRHTSHVTRHMSHVTRHTSHVTRHVPAEADGDVQAHGGGGGSAAAPVHRKTRI